MAAAAPPRKLLQNSHSFLCHQIDYRKKGKLSFTAGCAKGKGRWKKESKRDNIGKVKDAIKNDEETERAATEKLEKENAKMERRRRGVLAFSIRFPRPDRKKIAEEENKCRCRL